MCMALATLHREPETLVLVTSFSFTRSPSYFRGFMDLKTAQCNSQVVKKKVGSGCFDPSLHAPTPLSDLKKVEAPKSKAVVML